MTSEGRGQGFTGKSVPGAYDRLFGPMTEALAEAGVAEPFPRAGQLARALTDALDAARAGDHDYVGCTCGRGKAG
jgi:hypothetical protein